MKIQFPTEEKLVISCTKVNSSHIELNDFKTNVLLVVNWNNLYNLLISRGVGPLFYQKLSHFSSQISIPITVLNNFKQLYYYNLSRNIKLTGEFKIIAEFHRKENIPIIALKGIFLSENLYKDIALRQMSDIDILVHETDGVKCIEVLREIGYNPVDTGETEFVRLHEEIIHYRPMVKDGVSVEVHIKLHKDAEKYHLDNESLWKNAVPVKINGVEVLALGKYDQLIHLCIHLDKHFKAGHVQFTCFTDIVNYLEKFREDFDWNEFTQNCKEYNCTDEVFAYLILCNKYMNAYLPEYIVTKFQTTLDSVTEKQFINYMINGNSGKLNYGQGIKSHLNQLRNLNSWSEKKKYIIETVFPPKEFVQLKYSPIIQKYRLLQKKWWLLYPYRWYIGLKGVIRLIMKSKE